jgi:hypothetical protein
MTGRFSFFELGVADAIRARDFCGELFGGSMKPGPSGEEHGFQIETGTSEEACTAARRVRGHTCSSPWRTSEWLWSACESLAGRLSSTSTPGRVRRVHSPSVAINQGSSFGLHQPAF